MCGILSSVNNGCIRLAEYDDSEDEDEVVVVTPMQPEEQRVTHVEATGAADVLRNYMTSLQMPEECFMTLARLQRQILQERQKATEQQPSISSIFKPIRKK